MPRWFALAALALAGCLPDPVASVVLSPETAEIEQALRAADARWEAAGVDPDRVIIAPGGAPVRLVPERGIASETRTSGRGSAFAGVKWIELNSLDAEMVAHEIGHALGVKFHPDAESSEGVEACAPDAAHRPLMCSHVRGGSITAGDLEAACTAGECGGFNPES